MFPSHPDSRKNHKETVSLKALLDQSLKHIARWLLYLELELNHLYSSVYHHAAMTYWQGSDSSFSVGGYMASLLTLPSFSQDSVQFSLSSSILSCAGLRQFIKQWSSWHTEGNHTSPILFILNKKEGFNFNAVKLHLTKQVSTKSYSHNI